jgi:HK97 family phage portal protein
MSLLDSLIGRRGVDGGAGSPENPNNALTAESLATWFGSGVKSLAGVDVTPQRAMGLTAVYRAVALRSGTQAALPLHSYEEATNGDRSRISLPVLSDPHPDLTRFEVWEFACVSLDLWGNSYQQKIRNGLGQVVELWPIEPWRVKVGKVRPSTLNPSGKVFSVTDDDGREHAWTSREVLHIPGMGYDGVVGASPIRVAKQALGIGLAAEEYSARFFGNGSLMAGVLQTEQRLQPAEADALHKRWVAKVAGLGKAHDIVVLGNGTKFQPIGVPPRDAAVLESRGFTVADAARLFGLPPHLLGDTQKSTSYGAGIEAQGIQLVVYTLRSPLTRVEQRVTKELVRPSRPDGFAEYAVEGLLRGDSKARAAFYESGIRAGWMLRSEPRRLENLPAVPGLDVPLTPMNMALGAAPDPAADDTPPEPDDEDDADA